jgi:hypothetical protein
MRTRTILALTLALATVSSCRTVQRSLGLANGGDSGSTSVYGHWVLASPIDSTAFAGATQVELVLAPGSFNLSAAYPDRSPLALTGRAEVADGGLLTLVPASGASSGASDGAVIGFPAGQPFTRMASASGATLVLAPPSSRVPLPSSVWYRLGAARVAGVAR